MIFQSDYVREGVKAAIAAEMPDCKIIGEPAPAEDGTWRAAIAITERGPLVLMSFTLKIPLGEKKPEAP